MNDTQNLPTRRTIMGAAAALAGGAAIRTLAADAAPTTAPTQPNNDYTPVVTPNGVPLPWKLVDGVKVFHLIAEEVDHEFAPGLKAKCWGYNGRTIGPTIEAVEGDRIRIYVTNRLPEPTTVHWHGVLLPCGIDGVSGVTQKPIAPGETYKYEFTLRQHGTHMYHPHYDEMTQMALGMMGLLVIHPRQPKEPPPDRDFAILLSEWKITPGTSRPNPNEMTDFNVFTMNSKVFPATDPLVVKLGQRVRIRLGNLGAMDHHPIHLHGHRFIVTETDGGEVPLPARRPEATVLVPVGTTRTLEFVADAPGDWVIHCHMTHHVMNQMGHDIPDLIGVRTAGLDAKVSRLLPEYMTMGESGMGEMSAMGMASPRNSIPMVGGPGPFGTIDMGGMFTMLKVRDGINSYEDPGWFRHPEGTVAGRATAEEMRRDGVERA
jgi:FtsP/CotA-like multicopper oxidase with cupredoxin domain